MDGAPKQQTVTGIATVLGCCMLYGLLGCSIQRRMEVVCSLAICHRPPTSPYSVFSAIDVLNHTYAPLANPPSVSSCCRLLCSSGL